MRTRSKKEYMHSQTKRKPRLRLICTKKYASEYPVKAGFPKQLFKRRTNSVPDLAAYPKIERKPSSLSTTKDISLHELKPGHFGARISGLNSASCSSVPESSKTKYSEGYFNGSSRLDKHDIKNCSVFFTSTSTSNCKVSKPKENKMYETGNLTVEAKQHLLTKSCVKVQESKFSSGQSIYSCKQKNESLKLYRCPTCKNFFLNEHTLNDHFKSKNCFRKKETETNEFEKKESSAFSQGGKFLTKGSNLQADVCLIKDEPRQTVYQTQHVCRWCLKEFTDKTLFINHACSMPKLPKYDYFCMMCGLHFETPTDLDLHERSHNNQIKASEHASEYSASFKKHSRPLVAWIGNLERRRYLDSVAKRWCWACDQNFPDVTTKQVHEAVHSVWRPFKCWVCKERFAQMFLLTLHVQLHNKVANMTKSECL